MASPEQNGSLTRAQNLRELITDIESDVGHTVEDAIGQKYALAFLRKKFDETSKVVLSGD